MSDQDNTAGRLCLFSGPDIARYHFGDDHPFGPDRHDVFMAALEAGGLDAQIRQCRPVTATREQIALFHSEEYVDRVRAQSRLGSGYLDYGDTPAIAGIYEAAATVVGTAIAAADALMAGQCRGAFVPIAGLHHARRERAGGFCVFNDCGVVIEYLHRDHGLDRIAYVDIDAHHGDGVYYGFEQTPWLWFADLHEDGRYLYPGSGASNEQGRGPGRGRKLNLPMAPGDGDEAFMAAWETAENFVAAARPEFIIFQCGADSLAGDPLTHLRYSEGAHAHAARRLMAIARDSGHDRVLALGGGGYDRPNLARAWCAVVAALAEA